MLFNLKRYLRVVIKFRPNLTLIKKNIHEAEHVQTHPHQKYIKSTIKNNYVKNIST